LDIFLIEPVPVGSTPPISALWRAALWTGVRIFMVGGIIFAILYPLNRKEHHDVVQELEKRRQNV
jgi:Na+/melibiose symporter-like transporter